jgi:hypothetical protein
MMNMVADTIFKYFEMFIVPNDQDFKVINLNAMANYWPHGLQEDTAFTDYNARKLGLRSLVQGYEWIPMLQQLFFEGERNYLMSFVSPDTLYYNDPKGYYEYLLNRAPFEGPYNYGDSIWPEWEWSSTSRTIQPGRRGETGNAFPGNYNGLDYMLYYNMYRLLYPEGVNIREIEPTFINIYPNPCRDRLSIQAKGRITYDIFGLGGETIMTGSSGAYESINVGRLISGLYIIRITDENRNIYFRKFIKQ